MIDKDATGIILFLALYTILFSWMLFLAFTKRIKIFWSRWFILIFHVTIRLASCATGVVFYDVGFTNISNFIAYLVLAAEGYMTLVICAFRFLINWHRNNYPSRDSWLEPKRELSKKELRKRIFEGFAVLPAFLPSRIKEAPMNPIHALLVLANAAIITGGSYTAAVFNSENTAEEQARAADVAKGTRTAGQAVFLLVNFMLLFCITKTIRDCKRQTGKIHPTLTILLITWLVLIIRGIFGVLQASVWRLSYSNPNNYDEGGPTTEFTIIETVLTVLMEWLACLLLNMTWFTDRRLEFDSEPTALEADVGKHELSKSAA